MSRDIKRGQIYYVDLEKGVGSEQNGVRPCLVIQNNKGNESSRTVIIALITKVNKSNYLPVHVPISKDITGLKYDSVVMVEQIRTVDKRRLYSYISQLPDEVMDEIDVALAVSMISQSGKPLKDVILIDVEGEVA